MSMRMIDTRMWGSDDYFANLDPIEKLLFIYLITNDKINISGIYEVPLKTMSIETGIEKEMVIKILHRFQRDLKIVLCNGWIGIFNFIKYQNTASSAVLLGIKREIEKAPEEIKDLILTTLFEKYPAIKKKFECPYINISYKKAYLDSPPTIPTSYQDSVGYLTNTKLILNLKENIYKRKENAPEKLVNSAEFPVDSDESTLYLEKQDVDCAKKKEIIASILDKTIEPKKEPVKPKPEKKIKYEDKNDNEGMKLAIFTRDLINTKFVEPVKWNHNSLLKIGKHFSDFIKRDGRITLLKTLFEKMANIPKEPKNFWNVNMLFNPNYILSNFDKACADLNILVPKDNTKTGPAEKPKKNLPMLDVDKIEGLKAIPEIKEDILEMLDEAIEKQSLDTWLRQTEWYQFDDKVVIATHNEFAYKYILANYYDLIKEAFKEYTQSENSVNLMILEEK